MPVLDASIVVDALVVAGPAGTAARAELRGLTELQVPSLFAAEVASALRRLVQVQALSGLRASAALSAVLTMRTIQFPFEPFARRAWELRDNISIYDAWYVALAEQLATELVTADKRLADAPGPRCPVRYVSPANRQRGQSVT